MHKFTVLIKIISIIIRVIIVSVQTRHIAVEMYVRLGRLD